MKAAGYIKLMMWVCILFVSCIRERNDCPTEIRVYFDYPERNRSLAETGINPDEVRRISLFAFDENQVLTGKFDEEDIQFDKSYFINAGELAEGHYVFYAWGGSTMYMYSVVPAPVIGQTTFNELEFALNSIRLDTVRSKISPLFHAGKPGHWLEVKPALGRIDHVLNMRQNTYTIKVSVTADYNFTDEYNMVISDNNGRYRFDNAFLGGKIFHYVSNFMPESARKIEAELTVLRLDSNRSPRLKIETQKNPVIRIFNADLVKLITETAQQNDIVIDFDRMYQFHIEIHIEVEGNLHIKVNGYTLYEDDEVLE